MLETIGRNLWILLTLIIPGMFTYGLWRLLLILEPSHNKHILSSLNHIDSSVIASLSIIVGISLFQQTIAIAIEAVFCMKVSTKCSAYDTFLWKRFELAASEKFSENEERIIGNFFLSLNILIGQALLFAYFTCLESKSIFDWIPLTLIITFAVTSITVAFRFCIAKNIIENHLADETYIVHITKIKDEK